MNRQQYPRYTWRRSPSFLLVCPKNLKECIDWVLRATGKDNQNGSVNDDINKLNKALKAVVPSFDNNSIDLTQLVQGLCLFMGYPSCLCKPKKSVEESLEKISKELLKEELNFYKCSSITNPKLNLNCLSCKSDVVCKCCVLDCISKVQKSSCGCVKGSNNNDCKCSIDDTKRCCKDLLEKLKASLSLLNLKADMETLCKCPVDSDCCDKGECTDKSSGCPVCDKLKTSNATSDYTVTGLGLLRPSPKRLAKRLEGFFGDSSKKHSFIEGLCTCKCGSGSCCCLACGDPYECSKSCTCRSPAQCPCASKLSAKDCPRQKFCLAIDSIKIPADSKERTCCKGGEQCHCQVDPSTSGSQCSGKCCEGKKHSVKCMIRRLVKFFKDLPLDTSSKKFKSCCDLLCAAKTCYFLWDKLFKKGANGNEAQKFNSALQDLQYSSPCGQDLYRVLNDFLDCCFRIFKPEQKFVENKVKELQEACSNCCQAGTSCSCCSSGSYSCKACFALFNDYELKARFISEYSSSYTYKFESVIDPPAKGTYASWNSLCASKSGSCCSNPSCNSCTSGSCPPQGCCENCPKRLCAKIFLGMLPCMYWGLKILYDRAQDPVTWPTWSQKKIKNILVPASVRDASELLNFFTAWGLGSFLNPSLQAMVLPGLLENLFSSGSLNSLFQTSKKYFTSFPSRSLSSGSSVPSTVRSMLLWLYGLRFQRHFSELVENCKSLCLPFGNSFNSDAFCYYIYTCSFIFPVAIISTIQDSDSHVSTFFSTADSEFLKFSYPEDPSELLEKLCEYVRKIFVALKFLSIQCRLDRDSAGWQDCAFGRGCAQALQNSLKSTPAPSGSVCCKSSGPKGYLCTSKPGISNYHEHCTKPGVKCIGLQECTDTPSGQPKTDKDAHTSGKCTASCPHPLLMFLLDGSESKPQAFSYSLFKLPEDSYVPPMGFSKENLPTPGRHGRDLYDVLNSFCGSSSLTSLLKFLARISFHPPETLGEFFLFFKKLAEALNSEPLKTEFPNYVTGEPGFYNGQNFTNALKDALETLKGSSHSSSHSGSHPFDLYSLNDCHANKASNATCGPYLYSLTGDVYDIFIDSPGMYLSWICYLPKDFKTLLEEFKQKFSDCCSSGKCQKIVECPCALPFIYSQGFTFMSPGGLNCVNSSGTEHGQRGNQVKKHSDETNADCTRKTCKNFIDQLGKVLEENSPLGLLIKQIEKFLWHIRFPFFFGFLYVWFFVLSYFFYVILIKLDTFHTGSHLHLPRSFKILPSTLFSDASSKLKDLSYFTL